MIEYFDERSTEFLRKDDGEPDMDMNHHFLARQQAYYATLNGIKDVRLSEIYYALGIPFPDNYLIDYKFKKNELPFVFYYNKELGKIMIDIAVPDQPAVKDTGDDINKKPKWIPIEERLPESNDDLYLATDGHYVDTYYYCNDGFYFIAPLILIEDQQNDNRIFCNEIVAWMPLPEPYKKEE